MPDRRNGIAKVHNLTVILLLMMMTFASGRPQMKDMLKFLDEKAKLLSIAFDLDLRVPSASTLRWIQMVLNPMHISLTLYSLTTRSHPGIVLNSPILVFDGKTLYGAFDLKRKKHSPGLLSVYIHNLGTTLTANPCGKDGLEIETLLKAL